jgi:hypothetical protein
LRRATGHLARTSLLLALAVALAATATACGTTPAPSAVPASLAAVATPALTPTPASTAPATPAPATPGTRVAVEDPSLLGVLPAEVGGQPVVLESQAFADALADPDFAANVEAAAFGVVVSGDDLASALVARPVPGAFSEAWFRDWRDSYDEGACAQAGGIAGVAETDLGGRTMYVATCGGGLRTYHTWLDGPGLIVSALAVGTGRYGERLMAGLRP